MTALVRDLRQLVTFFCPRSPPSPSAPILGSPSFPKTIYAGHAELSLLILSLTVDQCCGVNLAVLTSQTYYRLSTKHVSSANSNVKQDRTVNLKFALSNQCILSPSCYQIVFELYEDSSSLEVVNDSGFFVKCIRIDFTTTEICIIRIFKYQTMALPLPIHLHGPPKPLLP